VPEKNIEYTNALTDEDRVKVRQHQDGKNILEFSVQYEALIDGRWRKITRYDSCHGIPHRHVFHIDGKEYRHTVVANDNNEAFTEALMVTKKNFLKFKENYLTVRRKNSNV
jgi:hypothetical protein